MAKRADYQAIIKEGCISTGTYKPEYDVVIKQLADVLELRQGAIDLYKSDGLQAAQKFTNREGVSYFKANPPSEDYHRPQQRRAFILARLKPDTCCL